MKGPFAAKKKVFLNIFSERNPKSTSARRICTKILNTALFNKKCQKLYSILFSNQLSTIKFGW